MAQDKKVKIIEKYMLPFLAVFLVWIVLAVKCDFFYSSNDDSMLEAILSGAYTGTPEAHDIYHLYPIAWLISVMYRILPAISWYGLFLCICQFGCFYLCLVRCGEFVNRVRDKLIVCGVATVFGAGLLLRHLVLVQYTMTAAVIASTAIFLLVTDRREDGGTGKFLLRRVAYLLLYGLAFCLRRQVGLLLLPFFILGCLYKCLWGSERQDDRKMLIGIGAAGRWKRLLNYAGLIVLLLGIMGVLWGIDRLAYSSAEWAEYGAWNDARTQIYDFGKIPPYEEEEEWYRGLGISGEEQMLLEKDCFALSDKYDCTVMQAVDSYQRQYFSYMYTKEYVKKVVLLTVDRLLHPDLPYGVVLIGLYLFAAVLFLLSGRYFGLLELGCIFLAHMLCWGYLIWQNRLPERVTHGLYLGEILLLAAISLQLAGSLGLTCSRETLSQRVLSLQTRFFQQSKRYLGYAVFFCLGIFGMVISVGALRDQYSQVRQNAEQWQAVKAYCRRDPDQLYLLDTYSFATYTEKMFGEDSGTKIGGGEDSGGEASRSGAVTRGVPVQNYVMCGGWTANSPDFADKLSLYGIKKSLLQALRDGQKLYFITDAKRDVIWLQEFLNADESGVHMQQAGVVFENEHIKYETYCLQRE